MRNISLFLLLPITVFAASTIYDADVIVPKAFQPDSPSPLGQTSQAESIHTDISSVIETRLPLPQAKDVIIPKVFQENAPSTEVHTVEQNLPQEAQSIAIERVINHSENDPNIIIPKALAKTPSSPRTETVTKVITPKTAEPIETVAVDIPQIQGTYVLKRGVERNAKIDNAMLIIEKLDENDFGYYYVSKISKFPASGLPGIFHYDSIKKKFVNKVKETEVSTKTEENIEIKYDGQHLETILEISVGKRAILWDKVDDNCQADPSIISALRTTKDCYTQVYKNNKNFLFD